MVEERLYVVLVESQDGLGEGTRLKFLQPAVCVSSTEIITMGVCVLVLLSDHCALSRGSSLTLEDMQNVLCCPEAALKQYPPACV